MTVAEEIMVLQRAAKFAALHHRHQNREDGTPYIAHPFRVCMTLRQAFGIDDTPTLAASLLHDLIEDTGVDYDDILEHFGEEVADLAAGMTKDMRLREDLRECAYDEQIRAGTWKLKAIKLADVFDNLCDAGDGKRAKAMAKAVRAIACAEGEARLAEAVALVRERIDDFRDLEIANLFSAAEFDEGAPEVIEEGKSWVD